MAVFAKRREEKNEATKMPLCLCAFVSVSLTVYLSLSLSLHLRTASRSLSVDHRGHQIVDLLHPRVLLELAQCHKHIGSLENREKESVSQ